MSKVGIFFGTDSGSTKKIAKMIQQKLGEDIAIEPININKAGADAFDGYEYLILGTPTYGEGELPGLSSDCQAESWEEYIENFDEMELHGKKIALFGLGDQVNYADEFVDGLGELYDCVVDSGAQIVGSWPTDGYEFNDSTAVEEDMFVGLVIDKDNQANMSEERVTIWVDQIKSEMGL